ncbi:response regulator [Altererythrobacter sp. B11]|uniref:response regulator n=1 Tax=Altererythrobacter sp. B11 TaxID=2060312 RepID=UPI000DC6E3FE|nr:response regulator [Altererythrobacter sp. B11]BBC73454.1 response regulator [Altererythrobacter sp. B11]
MTEQVLLVEDELFIALDLRETIENEGYRVHGPCATLRDVLRLIEEIGVQELAGAVLDVRLADGQVFPAADRLYSAGVPIIFHSGHASDETLRERYPQATICAKPCSPTLLMEALRASTAARSA